MSDALDRAALADLLEMVGNDPDFVDELVDAYLADVPQQAAALRAAFQAGDTDALVRPAHTLKGSSLNVGAARVAEIARAIEEHGRAGDLHGVGVLMADLEAARLDLAGELAQARARRWAS